jgi:lysozyme
MPANDTAAALASGLARSYEGFYAKPYLDPVGIPTIGYGFTRYANGRIVSLADPAITQDTAEGLLWLLMSRTAVSAQRLCPRANTGQLAALSDFAYNMGLARLAGSTLLRLARAGNWDAAKFQFSKWIYGGGKPLSGLVKRRAAEAALI